MENERNIIADEEVCNDEKERMEQQIAVLKKRVRLGRVREKTQKQELEELRAYVLGMSEKYTVEPDLHHCSRMYCEWKQRNVLVVGGHEAWQGKLREIFPNWKFAGNQKDISAQSLAGVKYIVCNTRILTQACYQKIQLLRNGEQKVLYVHSCSPERCMQELDRQIGLSEFV